MTRLISSIFIIAWSCIISVCSGQIDDTRSRHRVGISYDITNKMMIYAGYRLDTEYDLSAFRKGNIDIELDYRLNKHLELIGMYRFSTTYERDYHRMRLGMKYYYRPHRDWTLSLRSMLQHDVAYWDMEYLQTYNPRWVWRNKLVVQYELNKKTDIAIFDEAFANSYKMEEYFYRNRLGLDIAYRYSKRHKFSIGYFLQHSFNIKNPSTTQSFYTNYTYNIKRAKKKKDKTPKTRIRV